MAAPWTKVQIIPEDAARQIAFQRQKLPSLLADQFPVFFLYLVKNFLLSIFLCFFFALLVTLLQPYDFTFSSAVLFLQPSYGQ